MLTEILREFAQSLQTNSGIIPRLGHDRFLLNPFQFTSHPAFDTGRFRYLNNHIKVLLLISAQICCEYELGDM
jgi:hypothetical protein